VVDSTAPSGTFAIADGAEETGNLEVELNSDVEGAMEMRFTNDDEEWPEEWVEYSDTHDWVLADGPDGVRTVYAQYRNQAMMVLELNDEIMYDSSVGNGDQPGDQEPSADIFTILVLDQNYPNPFNPSTAISFGLPRAEMVRLTVHDLTGRTVARLVDGHRAAGRHTLVWSGTDTGGQRVASGTYVYRLVTGSQTLTRTMTLVK